VPATYLWNPGLTSPNYDWDNSSNWDIKTAAGWVPCGPTVYPGKPGTDDDVEFKRGAYNVICNVNVSVKLRKVTIGSDYTSSIVIKHEDGMTISGSNALSELRVDSEATIRGDVGGQPGKLIIEPKATFHWRTGKLGSLTVHINRGQNAPAYMSISSLQGTTAPELWGATINVWGELEWTSTDVWARQTSDIHVYQGGSFNIAAAEKSMGSQVSNTPPIFHVVNDGMVTVNVPGSWAKIVGNYTNKGTTQLKETSTLQLAHAAKQEANINASFQLLTGSTVALTAAGGTLDIRAGHIAGTGTVQGSLTIGTAPGQGQQLTAWISPGSVVGTNGVTINIGHINVTGNFHMFGGEMHIQVEGPNQDQYDRITVAGYAALGTPASSGGTSGGTLVGILLPVRAQIPANPDPKMTFLTYGSRDGDFYHKSLALLGPLWTSDKDATTYWLIPNAIVEAALGVIRGVLWKDLGPQAGVFEPGVEDRFANVGVELRDHTGNTVLASTTSNASGEYQFTNLSAGLYFIKFHLPLGQRFAAADRAPENSDSDPDPATGLAAVYLGEDDDIDDVFAGYFVNTAPIAVNDTAYTAKNISTDIDVLGNDSDPDGDGLAITWVEDPGNGTAAINNNGTPGDPTDDFLVYTPDSTFLGTETFQYAVSDGYGGVTYATVTVTVFSATYTVPHFGVTLTWVGLMGGLPTWIASDGWMMQYLPPEGEVNASWWLDGPGENQDWDTGPWNGQGSATFVSPVADPNSIEVVAGT
jgi:hypothetical protein